MPKVMTPIVRGIIGEKTGVSPVVAISILWGFDVKWYTSRKVSIPGVNAEPRIISMGSIGCQKTAESQGSTGSGSFTLDDSDGALKFYLDNVLIEKAKATAYLWFENTGFNDKVVLLDGHLTGPQWDDDSRALSLTLEAVTETEEFGFAPTKEDFKDLSDESVGVAWPAVFGQATNVPAVRVKKKPLGVLIADVRLTGNGYVDDSGAPVYDSKPHVLSYLLGSLSTDDMRLYISGSEQFPQDRMIKLSIDGVIFRGTFHLDTFKVEDANYPKYENVKCVNAATAGTEEVDNATKAALDVDKTEITRVAWITDSKVSLSNMFCYFTNGKDKFFNYCVKQIGKKCFFTHHFWVKGKTVIPDSTFRIERAYALAENGTKNEELEGWYWYYKNNLKAGNSTTAELLTELLQTAGRSANAFWRAEAGTAVSLFDLDDVDIYVASAVPMDSITTVMGKRTLKVRDGKPRKIFSPIPKDYYQIQLQSNFEVNKEKVSGLIVHTPLSEYQDQGWEDSIYVSGASQIGPNAVDIIEFLLDNYTELHTDGTFNAVRNHVDPFPCNFALFDRRNALEFAQEIAWQSRCALLKDSDSIGIRFLGQVPNPIMTFDESNIEQNSVVISATAISEIVTRYSGTWADSYKDSPQPQSVNIDAVQSLSKILRTLIPDTYREKTATKIYTRRENIDTFGLRSEDVNIYIYNKEEYVKKTIDFWGHRKANSWTLVNFTALNLDALILQPFDGIALIVNQAPIFLNVIATVQSIDYNHQSKTVSIQAWLPMIAGRQSVDSRAYSG